MVHSRPVFSSIACALLLSSVTAQSLAQAPQPVSPSGAEQSMPMPGGAPGGPPPGMPPGMPPQGAMPEGMPPMPAMPSTADTEYTAAIYVEAGLYDAERSVAKAVKSGAVTNQSASDVVVAADQEDFSGVFVRGEDSIFSINNARLDLHGDGTNDFLGLGAGVMAEGGATVILRDSNVQMHGVIAAATIATRDATMRVYNSTLHSHGGELPADFVPVIGPGMKTPPAPLGITGTARTNVTMGNAKSYFYNSTIISEGWGALSTDACGGEVYLEANNSKVIANNSGYGFYSDNGCRVVFNDSSIKSATFGGILAGVAYAELNNVASESADSTLMVHSVMGRPSESATVKIKGGTHVSGKANFLIKSANLVLDIDGADLQPKNGNLIRAIVNDDSHATKVDGADTPGINISLKNMNLVGDIRHEDGKDREMQVALVNTQLSGAVVGAKITADKNSKWTATADSQARISDPSVIDAIDALPGVHVVLTLESDGSSGADFITYKLPSGGILEVAGEENNPELVAVGQ